MSVSGISGSDFIFELINAENAQAQNTQNSNSQSEGLSQIESEFAQLGEDLQAGNLSSAQQDFSSLSSALTSAASESQTNSASSNPVAQAFNQLQQDLQNGNLGAAQQDFAALQQALQQGLEGNHPHHHHHHASSADSQEANTIQQDFSALAQALQSGNLSSAQTAFSTLQQDLQQFASGGAGTTSSWSSAGGTNTSSSLNVSA